MPENEKEFIGEIVKAACKEITQERVIAQFNASETVFVPRSELPQNLTPGDTFEVYIDGMSKNGIWVGSIDKIAPAALWKHFAQCRQNQTDIDVTVIADDDNGLICDVESLLGFMPKREIEESPLATLGSYVGQKMKARILKFSQADGKLIVSHKAAVAEKLRETRESLLAQLKPEQIYEGTVKQIVDFGAFVDIGAGVEGLVHRSNLSWGNDDPASVVSIGQQIKVIVLAINNGKISLGHKQLIEDTWAESSKKLTVGDIVEGKVTTFANFGAFVRINDQVEGLIHNSELSWQSSVRQAQQVLKLNQNVKVRIIGIDEERRRLRLSLRRVQENPWQQIFDACPPGTKLNTKISGIADFGIFVDLNYGLRGLIHKNDLPESDGKIDLNEKYHIGDPIECIVVSVDVEKERANLSVRQLAGDPFQAFVEQKPLGKSFEAVIRRIARFGAFAAIGDVEGLIHISELSENRVENVGSVVKVGQTVQVTVINIDENRRRIGLSMIAEPFEPNLRDDSDSSDNNENTDSQSRPTLGDIFPENLKK